MPEISDEQNRAIAAVADWYKNSDKQFFYLGGYAGSGKTTIAKYAVEACGLNPDNPNRVLYGSFTGKAALVMRNKGMFNASTIHSMIYHVREKTSSELSASDESNDIGVAFSLNPDSAVASASIVVLDECSMVSRDLAEDLLYFGVKVLVLGDPAQLSPVAGSGYFTNSEPDYFLREIHRQALENPIIRIANDVREGKSVPMCDLGQFAKVPFSDITDDTLLGADQILTGTNNTRHALNEHMLYLNNIEGECPLPLMPDIKVICLRNYKDIGTFNGLIGTTMDHVPDDKVNHNKRYFVQRVATDYNETPELLMSMGPFQQTFRPLTLDEKNTDKVMTRIKVEEGGCYQWDYAYAITVHKAQGSQWDNVILIDDGHLSWDIFERRKWLYTAITRAAENLTIAVTA